MSSNKILIGRAVLGLVLLTTGCLRSVVAGSVENAVNGAQVSVAVSNAAMFDGFSSLSGDR